MRHPAPHRAHSIILNAGADTIQRLGAEMRLLASRLERGELNVGTIGGSDAHSTYSYRHDPVMTHDRYFRDIDAYLANEEATG